jgi:hypothetical protein
VARRTDDLLVTAPQRDSRPAVRWRQLLDGRWYGLRLAWNVRDRRWYIDISTDAGVEVVVGVAVESGLALFGGIVRDELPPGQLYVDDVEGLGRPPDRFSWSSFSRMFYRPAAVVALAAGTADELP